MTMLFFNPLEATYGQLDCYKICDVSAFSGAISRWRLHALFFCAFSRNCQASCRSTSGVFEIVTLLQGANRHFRKEIPYLLQDYSPEGKSSWSRYGLEQVWLGAWRIVLEQVGHATTPLAFPPSIHCLAAIQFYPLRLFSLPSNMQKVIQYDRDATVRTQVSRQITRKRLLGSQLSQKARYNK